MFRRFLHRGRRLNNRLSFLLLHMRRLHLLNPLILRTLSLRQLLIHSLWWHNLLRLNFLRPCEMLILSNNFFVDVQYFGTFLFSSCSDFNGFLVFKLFGLEIVLGVFVGDLVGDVGLGLGFGGLGGLFCG